VAYRLYDNGLHDILCGGRVCEKAGWLGVEGGGTVARREDDGMGCELTGVGGASMMFEVCCHLAFTPLPSPSPGCDALFT